MCFQTIFVGLRRGVALSSAPISGLGLTGIASGRFKSTRIMCPVPRKAPSAIGAVVEPRLAISKKSMVKTNSKVETKSKVETNSKLETKSKEVNKSSTKSKSVAATKSILKTESVMKSKLAAKASTVNAPKVVLVCSDPFVYLFWRHFLI